MLCLALENKCRECLNAAFKAAQQYADTFDAYCEFYRDNEQTDVDDIRKRADEHNVEFFATSLEKYHREEVMARAIVSKRSLGMLLVDSNEMKSKLIPNPIRCLDVVNEILPEIAKKRTDALIAEAQDATFKLELKPKTTIEYVESLTFLEQIQDRVNIIGIELFEVYNLVFN